MDLSKVFGTIRHVLPTATFFMRDFNKDLLKVLHSS